LLLVITNPKTFAAFGVVYSSHALVLGTLVADGFAKVLTLAAALLFVNPRGCVSALLSEGVYTGGFRKFGAQFCTVAAFGTTAIIASTF